MKKYIIRITEGPKKNDGVNFTTTHQPIEVTKCKLLRLKRSHLKNKVKKYKIEILEGAKEPLLIREKLRIVLRTFMAWFKHKKTIAEMQTETIRREYYHKKYLLIIILITAIASSLITLLLNHFVKFK